MYDMALWYLQRLKKMPRGCKSALGDRI
jgi:hypothetical protein